MKFYYFIGKLLQPFAAIAFFLYSHIFHIPRARLVLKNENGEILLVQSSLSGNAWGMPGGGIHRNEDAAAAACRELAEETGIVLDERELTPLFVIKSAGHEETVFQATIVEENLQDIVSRKFEIKDSGWFSPNSLPKLEPAAVKIATKMAIKG